MSFSTSKVFVRRFGLFALTAVSCILPIRHLQAADPIPGYVVVPITVLNNHNLAVMRATVNGKPTSFILDTGASTSLLDDSFYKGSLAGTTGSAESKLPPELRNVKASANGVKAEIGYVNTMKSGPMDFGGGPVLIMNMSQQFSQHNNYNNAQAISGMLGEDVLRKYSAIIDWGRRGVYFNTDPAKRLKLGPGLTSAGWTAIPMIPTNDRRYTVACTVEDKSVQLLVDTGATFTAFSRDAIKLRNIMYNRDTGNSMSHLATNTMLFSMMGMDSYGYLAKIENWKIGNYLVPNSIVMTSAMATGVLPTESGSTPVVGLLGAEVLARNNAIVDIAGSTIYLKPPAGAAKAPKPTKR